MKLIIAGGRKFDDYDLVCRELEGYKPECVISGTAIGADTLGIRWADMRGIPIVRMPAQWHKFGNEAGFIRNEEMAKVGTHLVAFWDGKSRGTKSMIWIARQRELDVKVVRYEG